MKNLFSKLFSHLFFNMYLLHFFNDGFEASILLLLPFIAKDFHISLTEVGILGTLIASFDFIFALPAGYLGTKIGGLKTLIVGLFFYAIGFTVLSFSPTYLLLFPAFILAAIGFGLFHPIAFALVARFAHKNERGKQMGNMMATGDVGKVSVSALLTFFAAYVGWHYTTLGYGLLALVIGIFLYVRLFHKKEKFVAKKPAIAHVSNKEIITNIRFIFAVGTNFFDSLASSAFFLFLPFLLLKRHVSPALLGSFTAGFLVGNLIGRLALGRFVDRYNPTVVFIIAEVLMAVFIIFLSQATSFILIVLFSLILGVFTKGTTAVTQTMITESGEHHGHFEKLFAFKTLFVSIATSSAPFVYGFISDKFGIVTTFLVMAVMAIIATIPALGFHVSKRLSKTF